MFAEMAAWLQAPPQDRSSAHDDHEAEPPPTPAQSKHKHRLPEGVPHIPSFLFAKIQVNRNASMAMPDYTNVIHHMFNYLAVLNGLREDGFEIVGGIHEVPEINADIVSAVCLVDCDGECIDFDSFLAWAHHFIMEGADMEDDDDNEGPGEIP